MPPEAIAPGIPAVAAIVAAAIAAAVVAAAAREAIARHVRPTKMTP